jgi:hypothetical protein
LVRSKRDCPLILTISLLSVSMDSLSLISPRDIASINGQSLFDLTKGYCQYQWTDSLWSHQGIWWDQRDCPLILTRSLGEIKERLSIDTDNIPWWDQRESVHSINGLTLFDLTKGYCQYQWTDSLWSHQGILSVSMDSLFDLTKGYSLSLVPQWIW